MTVPGEAALPLKFRKLDMAARRAAMESVYGEKGLELGEVPGSDASLADDMVESAVGYLPVPLGIATGFLIDGRSYDIPMAVEEPSVLAAATFAAQLVRTDGGFSTWATEPIMTAQVFLEGVPPGSEREIQTFCATNYQVSFPMSAKLDVNGATRHPLYAWLTDPSNGHPGDIEWNFEKFLIGRDGRLLKRYPATVPPQDNGLLQDIADAL